MTFSGSGQDHRAIEQLPPLLVVQLAGLVSENSFQQQQAVSLYSLEHQSMLTHQGYLPDANASPSLAGLIVAANSVCVEVTSVLV